jgi:hypothetical protein
MKLIVCDDDGTECAEHAQHFALEGQTWTDGSPTPISMKDISDGYHTFGELYEHRMALTLALARSGAGRVWRSKQHHPDDGPMFDDSFIVGIVLPSGTITYHYNLKFWDLFDGIRELNYGNKWDGATPNDTIERLLNYRKGVHVY